MEKVLFQLYWFLKYNLERNVLIISAPKSINAQLEIFVRMFHWISNNKCVFVFVVVQEFPLCLLPRKKSTELLDVH